MTRLAALDKLHSWKLERLSPKTFGQDITIRGVNGLGKSEVAAVTNYLSRGCCYRCRVGKKRWHYGESAEMAIAAAIKGMKP